LGAAYVAANREHLAIDLLLQRSSPERKYKLEIIIAVCIIIFSVTVLILEGTWLAYTRFYLSVQSAAMGLPLGIVYLVLPISGILITYFDIDNIIKWLKLTGKTKIMEFLEIFVLVFSFLILLVIGVPIAFSIGISGILTMLVSIDILPALTTFRTVWLPVLTVLPCLPYRFSFLPGI
jgi:hypothetical protein